MPTLTAPDGTLLVYDMYEAAAPRAAVLALHGWADHAGRWRDVGERLCAAGYSTYFLDLRGFSAQHAPSSPEQALELGKVAAVIEVSEKAWSAGGKR